MLNEDQIQMLLNECLITFSLSSGPGGQNVNKNHTKATLRWSLTKSQIPEIVKSKLFKKLAGRLTALSEIVIHSQASRSQSDNEQNCRKKLILLVNNALKVPKRRVPTKPSKASKARRLDEKRRAGLKKKLRKKIDEE